MAEFQALLAEAKRLELGLVNVELFYSFHNKINGNTCILTLYHGYISLCAHVLQTFSHVWDISDWNFLEILTKKDD